MGILDGLASMGLGKLEGADLYAKEEKKVKKDSAESTQKKEISEKDFIFEKSYECPVCYKAFKESKVKSKVIAFSCVMSALSYLISLWVGFDIL